MTRQRGRGKDPSPSEKSDGARVMDHFVKVIFPILTSLVKHCLMLILDILHIIGCRRVRGGSGRLLFTEFKSPSIIYTVDTGT